MLRMLAALVVALAVALVPSAVQFYAQPASAQTTDHSAAMQMAHEASQPEPSVPSKIKLPDPLPPSATHQFPKPAAPVHQDTPAPKTVTPQKPQDFKVPDDPGNPNAPTLLGSYLFNDELNQNQSHLVYRPFGQYTGCSWSYPDYTWGQINTCPSMSPYNNFDYLQVPNEGINRTNTSASWLTLNLNRAAEVVLVWRSAGAVPPWVATDGFTRGALSGDYACGGQLCPTYVLKTSGPGAVALGGTSDGAARDAYYVLLGEANGQPPAKPSQSGSPAAQPNQLCPSWVHDQWVTKGPDGQSYPTWHPSIDTDYYCYFGHEHGSNPALFWDTPAPASSPGVQQGQVWKPAFGYAGRSMGMNEAHAGFKGYAFVNPSDGSYWYVVQHQGTSSAQALCEGTERGATPGRYHELDFFVRQANSNWPAVRIYTMADFGVAINSVTQKRYTPPQCPNQGLDVTNSASKQIPAAGDPGYEPWRTDTGGNALGLIGVYTFNTLDQGRQCDNNTTCDSIVYTGSPGVHRYGDWNSGASINSVTSGNPGADVQDFCTDTYGEQVTGHGYQCGGSSQVKQFEWPGLSFHLPFGDPAHPSMSPEDFFLDYGNQTNRTWHGGDAYSQRWTEGDPFNEGMAYMDIHNDGGFSFNEEGSIAISSTDPN